jgi:y4mF family transcriptional regulator
MQKSPGSIGEFVRARRKARGLTQAQLADIAGVGARLISELEREKPTLRMDAVNKVLRVFGHAVTHGEMIRNLR